MWSNIFSSVLSNLRWRFVHRCLVAGPKKFHVFPQSSHRRTTSLPNDGDFQGKLKLFRAGSNKLNQN